MPCSLFELLEPCICCAIHVALGHNKKEEMLKNHRLSIFCLDETTLVLIFFNLKLYHISMFRGFARLWSGSESVL